MMLLHRAFEGLLVPILRGEELSILHPASMTESPVLALPGTQRHLRVGASNK